MCCFYLHIMIHTSIINITYIQGNTISNNISIALYPDLNIENCNYKYKHILLSFYDVYKCKV